MERSPLFLAALASAAVPGLEPVRVEGLLSSPGQLFDVAFVDDATERRWVVRAPRTAAAGAQMDVAVTLLSLLARRLPFAVPMPRGFAALSSGGRAAVYPYLPGQPLDFSALPADGGVTVDLGRCIAALHNADHRLFDEAGTPSYDTDTWRTRRLSDLDRAAAIGQVPPVLLARWERALEDVSLWRYAPTPVHGGLSGDRVLVVVEEDGTSGRVRAVTGWEDAKVADPAEDFAALVVEAPPEALETVMEAYAHARAERPDANLLVRARLAAELRLIGRLLAAHAAKETALVEEVVDELRRLLEHVGAREATPDDYHSTSLEPRTPRAVVLPPERVDEDDEDDVPEDETGSRAAGEQSAPGAPAAPEAAATAEPGTGEALATAEPAGEELGDGQPASDEPVGEGPAASGEETGSAPAAVGLDDAAAGPEPTAEAEDDAPVDVAGSEPEPTAELGAPGQPHGQAFKPPDRSLAPPVGEPEHVTGRRAPIEFEIDEPDDPMPTR